MPKTEKKEATFKVPDKPIKPILKKKAEGKPIAKSPAGTPKASAPSPASAPKPAKFKPAPSKAKQAANAAKAANSTKEKQKQTEKEKEKAKEVEEESSSSSFNFDEDSESHSDSASRSVSTSEISSSVTDDFKKQKLEIALDDETTKKLTDTLEKKKKPIEHIKTGDPRGVIYLGHLPFGFFEAQMKAFFSQFGIVTRIRLSRNKKTGKSKHYAFVEFLDPIVAEIVADTMDGYMMYHRVLKCQVVPPEQVHPKMFHGANKKFVPKPTQELHKKAVNKRKTPDQREKTVNNLVEKEKAKREKLAAAGIDYDFPGYTAEVDKEKKRKATEEPTPKADARPSKKAKKQ